MVGGEIGTIECDCKGHTLTLKTIIAGFEPGVKKTGN